MSLLRTLRFIANHPLNRDRKAHALLGFLKWQIGSRLVPGSVVVDWVRDTRVIVRPGDTGMTQNVYCGLQDLEDMAYVLHVMTPQDLFVDVGANVGSYTVLACAVSGARGYCFEPVPATYRRLLDNLAINNLASRVKAMNIGLASEDGELNFTDSENCTNHVIVAGESRANSIRVPVHSLDSILGGESPSLIKIDVEGFEQAVLDGAEAVLANPLLHSVLMEFNGSGNRYGFDEESILRKMENYGFSTYAYDPFTRELHSRPGKNALGNNTLFIKNERVIRERLDRAPRISVGTQEL
ncbi:MAG TPA: FkbM family methyltransferase [Acidobacteriaceae bacterium]|jgi:FkbM family methyltransferase|nr:FkbM family methyltransferase [Acidobacteriaceae bacterium]